MGVKYYRKSRLIYTEEHPHRRRYVVRRTFHTSLMDMVASAGDVSQGDGLSSVNDVYLL